MPMESRISCLLCGDILPVPENAQEITCPHCGAHIPRPSGETVPPAVSACGEPSTAASAITAPAAAFAPTAQNNANLSKSTPKSDKPKSFLIAAACAVGMVGLIVLGIITAPISRQKLMNESLNAVAAYEGMSRREVRQIMEFRPFSEFPETNGSGSANYDIRVYGIRLGNLRYKYGRNGGVQICKASVHTSSNGEAKDLTARVVFARAAVLPLINHYMDTSYSLKDFNAKIAAEAQYAENARGYAVCTFNWHNCLVTETMGNNFYSMEVCPIP